MLRGAGTGAPEHAGAVRVIDVHSRIVAVGQCDKVRQRDDVTVLTEHAVAGDDLDVRLRPTELLLEIIHVEVAERERRRTRRANPFADAQVVELVREECMLPVPTRCITKRACQRRCFHECWQHADVGQISGREEESRLLPFDRGQPCLESLI